ncbi:hypothetical protein [Agriterribacter sp.]|uniref:hypothetical protein n=1 Tax=Agriterribacter sp. TaxID=2821509 RepID=UPI002C75FB7F|nr:hypothetical protein [Agriterribacter sp.]HRO47882.1 hypothetical protein [Agriterribacter sp.]HRQ18822.1 hypothetical protein [Agriterribacter sp.]
MNYKLLKGGHLPDRKCREILELFCDDLTATQIADISRVSRVTVNNYFRIIRSAIASFCEAEASLYTRQQLPVLNTEGTCRPDDNPAACYGFCLRKGKVSTAWLNSICPATIQQLYNGHEAKNGESSPGFEAYQAVADCNNWRLYWLAEDKGASSVANALPEITGFWKYTKSRLQKFRGMNKNTLYLHIKECEFRYNLRNDDILIVLTDIINARRHSTDKVNENPVVV